MISEQINEILNEQINKEFYIVDILKHTTPP